jgi:hypothetical protein
MAHPAQWDKNAVNESFVYRGQDAKLRLKECLAKAKSNSRYQWFADEAAAKASVYDYLDGKSFLASRENCSRPSKNSERCLLQTSKHLTARHS